FRYQLSLDAEVIIRDHRPIPAQILNVSEGGLAMRLLDRAHLYGPVTVGFRIPGARGRKITVKAVPSWSAEHMFGMRYLSMVGESRFAYDKWLASMQVSWLDS